MNPRKAFQVFIRYQLQVAVEERKLNLTAEEIEKFANGVEDDFDFYERLHEFLSDFIDDYGENYDL